ncbi:MAG TPA: NAD(P)-binding domain-containing protein [Polyangiaceae bacterium]|nr:NAD(P)-binding domain-containing protein [Polyangiaceae bacterium]
MSRPAVAVIGGGTWGVALAAAAARTGGLTLLLSRRFLRGEETPPPGVTLARDEADVAERARVLVLAVPSGVARDVAAALGARVDGRHFVVHGVRGLVSRPHGDRRDDRVHELETVSDIVRDETPVRRVGALGGPALASDLLAGRPTVMACASRYPEVTRALLAVFTSPDLRLDVIDDLLGLEWASALVGCLAIGAGYARGAGLGPGQLAAMITRAVEEAARLASAAGGHERTLLGLAGYGDLLASIDQRERPEVVLGAALAQGKSLDAALADAQQRVEAVELTARVVAWAEAKGVHAPILGAVAHHVLAGRPPAGLLRDLLSA